jgi:hypothetical protein
MELAGWLATFLAGTAWSDSSTMEMEEMALPTVGSLARGSTMLPSLARVVWPIRPKQ